jgi:putative addiction module killer protein
MTEVLKTDLFSRWMGRLRDHRARARIAARIDRMVLGNQGNVRSLGGGVSELKIHYGPGYRVYFLRCKSTQIVLLYGGDKHTQSKDIKIAKQLAANFES